MNTTTKQKFGAYAANQRSDETVRETEAHALLSCASKLDSAIKNKEDMDSYIDAIKHNQQLWTLFQVCLCEPDNALPLETKKLLLSLSKYIDKTSFKALTEYNPDLLKSMIDINRNIAAGLSVKNASESSSNEAGAAEKGFVRTSA
jgi:flagellar protein FlaF